MCAFPNTRVSAMLTEENTRPPHLLLGLTPVPTPGSVGSLCSLLRLLSVCPGAGFVPAADFGVGAAPGPPGTRAR